MSNQMIDDLIKEQHHRRFTNRETELDLFEQLALLSAPPFRIMGIHGTGGIGKTELLDEFRILCKEWDIPYLRVDGYAQKNLLSILSQLRTQAGKWVSDYHFSDFDRYLSLYLKMQKVASREEELIAGLQQTLRRSPHERAIVGALESAEKESITTLLSDLFEREDIQFYLNAENFLTEKLTAGFFRARIPRVVLFIDAYEVLSSLDNWVRDNLVCQLPDSFRVIIAGREEYSFRWHDMGAVFRDVRILALDEQDTRKLLEKRGITEEDLINEIFELTDGHPLLLAMAADAKGDNPNLSPSDIATDKKYLVIKSFISAIKGSLPAPVKEAFDICAIVRFFNEDTIGFFLGKGKEADLFAKVRTYSFIKKRSYGFSLHDAVWADLNTEQRQKALSKFMDLNRKAIAFYTNRLQESLGRDWERYAIEILYHKLTVDPSNGPSFLGEWYEVADSQYRLDICEALIREAQTCQFAELADWVKFFEARLANSRDEWEQAQSGYNHLLTNKALPSELAAAAIEGLGRVLYRLGDIEEAQRRFAQVLDMYVTAGRKKEAAQLMLQMAKIKLAQRNWRSAKKLLEGCISQFSEILNQLPTDPKREPVYSNRATIERERARALTTLGTIYFEQGDWDQALDRYNQSLDIFANLKDDFGIALSLYRVGWALQQKGKWREAETCYLQSRDKLTRLGADYRIARTIVKIADLYRMEGRLAESEEIYLECMRICIRLKALLGISVVLDSLGCLYQARGQLAKAEKMHTLSLERKRKQEFRFEIELTLLNMGDLKAKQNQLEQAIDFYCQSLTLMQHAQNRYGEALVLIGLCEVHARLERVDDKVRKWLGRVESLSKRHKYKDILSRVARLRGNWYFSSGNTELGIQQYREALKHAKNFNEYVYQEMRESLLSRIPESANLQKLEI